MIYSDNTFVVECWFKLKSNFKVILNSWSDETRGFWTICFCNHSEKWKKVSWGVSAQEADNPPQEAESLYVGLTHTYTVSGQYSVDCIDHLLLSVYRVCYFLVPHTHVLCMGSGSATGFFYAVRLVHSLLKYFFKFQLWYWIQIYTTNIQICYW